MFIPIHAKADILSGDGAKKGRLTPEQAAQLNAWCLQRKTGYFDELLGECSVTSNTFNAVGQTANVTFRSGYLAICGRLIQCEEGSSVVVSTPSSGSVNGKIVARFDLNSKGEEEFKVIATTETLTQQDLNENTSGRYDLELYSYTAYPDYVKIGNKLAKPIVSIEKEMEATTELLTELYVPMYGYDTLKGTIEERLTRLGFKSGAISFAGSNYGSQNNVNTASNGVFRQGNYVFGNIKTQITPITHFSDYFASGKTMFTVDKIFAPSKDFHIEFYAVGVNSQNNIFVFSATLNTNGQCISTGYRQLGGYTQGEAYTFNVNFGYEAPPIE